MNGKYSNTTYISKIWPESKKPRFLIKTPEPQTKQKNPRSSEKKTAVATLTLVPRDIVLTNKVWESIQKNSHFNRLQLPAHFKAKREKGVGTPFPGVPPNYTPGLSVPYANHSTAQQWCKLYRIRLLASNPAGYWEFFGVGLDIVSSSTGSGLSKWDKLWP